MKLENDNSRTFGKFINMWKFKITLLMTNESKMNHKGNLKCFEINESENTTY